MRQISISIIVVVGVGLLLLLSSHDNDQDGSVDSQRSLLSLMQPHRGRGLGDKYHPEKEDISCTTYFPNGTSATITLSAMDGEHSGYGDREKGDGRYQGGGGRGRGLGDFWGWLNAHEDGHPHSGNGQPPPCRGASDDGRYGDDDGDDDDNDDDASSYYNNDDPFSWQQVSPAPVASPTTMPTTYASSTLSPTTLPTTISNQGSAFPVAIPSPTPTEDQRPYNSDLQGDTSSTVAPTAFEEGVSINEQELVPAVATPPPWDDEPEEMEQQQQTHYYTTLEADDEDESYFENIVRIAVSVALPPRLHRGIPKEVSKAMAVMMNITSVLRTETMLEEFLADYDEDSTTAKAAKAMHHLLPRDEIPYILEEDQPFFVFMKYSASFRKLHKDRAFFWELVDKPTRPIPVERIVVSGNVTGTNNTTIVRDPSSQRFARWFVHRVSYRCYERAEDGLLVPILDTSSLSLIELQLQQWLEFHLNVTKNMMGTIVQDHALDIVLPGNEYDVDRDSLPRPSHSMSSSSSSSSSSSWDGSGSSEDDYYWQMPQGTYTEPLVATGATMSNQQQAGWILLVATLSVTVVWTWIARSYRRQQEAHLLWGTAANGGTEELLHPVLNVGWSIREAGDANDRQVLVIYDKTQQPLSGYRDDDSMLQGGIPPPLFPVTDDGQYEH